MTSGKPNVLFCFTDDQRFDTIGALGTEQVSTPTLDRLVAEGTCLTHAHIMGSTSPAVCMPSRAMLHTGRTLFRIEGAGEEIPAEHVLMGEHFRRAGYETFGTGKWHNGSAAYARSFSAGAEIFFGGMDDHWNVPACDFDPTGRYEPTPMIPSPGSSKAVRRRQAQHIRCGRHSSDLFADAAVEFLRRRDASKPFLMYVSFMAPHDPRDTHAEYHRMYDPAGLPLPANFLAEHPFDNGELRIRDEVLAGFPRRPEEVRQHLADYYAMISHADAAVGRVLAALKQTGEYDHTILVFAGDNGLAVGRHGLMGKQNLYEHSIRVPLIFAGPGIPAGQRCASYAYLLDIFPTLCELTGIPTPASVEGRSLAPLLGDPAARVREMTYFAYTDKHRACKDDRHKLIEYVVDGRHCMTQLFDLAADPWELHNLADDPAHADVLAGLRAEMARQRDESGELASPWGRTFWEGFSRGGR